MLHTGERDRDGGRTHVAVLREAPDDPVTIDPERVDHGLRVHRRDLMEDVVAHVEPPLLVAGILPPELGDLGAGFEQPAGVGAHALE